MIDPNECIDCTLCVPECPVDAIYAEEELPEGMQEYLALNTELAALWPAIVQKKDALPEADRWSHIKGKRDQLRRE